MTTFLRIFIISFLLFSPSVFAQTESCNWYDPSCALDWIADELKAFFLWVYDGLLSGFAGLLELIPVPDFMYMSHIQLPSGVAYFADTFMIPEGLKIIATAYTARFILRRIPAIG